MRRGFTRLLVVGVVLVLTTGIYLAARLDSVQLGLYTPRDKEFYLTPNQMLFIRPGLQFEVLDIAIPDDLKPLITFSITDPAGLPLDLDGVFTPGPVSVRFIMAYLPAGETQYVNYSGPGSRDRNGTVEEIGNGVYTYKFNTMLPDDWDADATHTLAGMARRDLREWGLSRYLTTDLEHFVPSGSAMVEKPRDVVTIETCNARCHDPLLMHGSNYNQVGACVLCHTPDLVDDGVSYSFNTLIHRVHKGLERYPPALNDCEVCHTGGIPTPQFPLVASPNPVPVCDMTPNGTTTLTWKHSGPVEIRVGSADGKLFAIGSAQGSATTGQWVKDGTELYLIDQNSGETVQKLRLNTTVLGCVGNPPGAMAGMAGSQHTAWLTRPSRLACGGCHEDVNFETGEGHSVGLPQPTDDFCGICHPPQAEIEFNTSIPGAHTVNYKSAQLDGVLVKLISITNTAPGQRPTVTYALSSKKGPISPTTLDRLRFSIAGPNDDFDYYLQETAHGTVSGARVDASVKAGSYWNYTFQAAVPAGAEGSYTLGVEGRGLGTVNGVAGVRDQAENSTLAFAVTDAAPVPRRRVVEDVRCEACHSNLAMHGSNRHDPNYCITCHQPAATDEEEREPGDPPESIHLKHMVHKIHAGAELERGFEVGGRDYGDLEFPGDLRNCRKCHIPDSYLLPLPDGLLPTTTERDFFAETLPTAAACLSCHDSEAVAAHADTMTSSVGEACAACHGVGKEFDVERVHAR